MVFKKDLFEKTISLHKTATAFGFKWSHYSQLLRQINEEREEVEEVIENPNKKNELQEELGDLMLAVLDLVVFCGFSPEKVLDKSLTKFQRRFDTMIKLAKADGYIDFREQPMELALTYWDKAKKILNKEAK